MNFNTGKYITMNSGNVNLSHTNGKRKLMVIIDEMDEGKRILNWINDFSSNINFTWFVVFGEFDLSDSHLTWLNENFRIAEKLSAEKIFCLRTGDITSLLKIASTNNATHIICSKSIKRKLQLYLFVKEFLKRLSSPNGQFDKFWLNENDPLKHSSNIFIGNN